ncbi:MAG TPA: ribosomal protein S18-alanine N-acetyltransferase [Terriglobia bacterium]|nr:ribosomal protein S18-alanine N-acetyltransferase [Terriglobia bacterium]
MASPPGAPFTIRLLSAHDLPAVLRIQADIFPGAGWTAGDYTRLIQEPGGFVLAAEETADSRRLAGFLAARQVLDEGELLSLAVDPAYQRMGIGRALLRELLRRLAGSAVERLYLEVRPSNEAALGLYYSEGFTLKSIRRGYYSDPIEDACVLSRAISRPVPAHEF